MAASAFHCCEPSTVSAVVFSGLFFAKPCVEIKNDVKYNNDNKHRDSVDTEHPIIYFFLSHLKHEHHLESTRSASSFVMLRAFK